MRAIIEIEFGEDKFDEVTSTMRVLSLTADRYDCIMKNGSGPFLRTVKGPRIFDLSKFGKNKKGE